MTLFDAIILGIIQGVTEFLPISSSGHLVLGQALLGVDSPGNVVEVVTHLGTLLSVIWVFWKDLSSILISFQNQDTQKYILFLIMGTLPAVIIGLAARDMITDLFDSIPMVAGSLIFTGIILLLTGLLIGLTQAFAMIPGISRSGMTISTGLALGLSGKDAAKFSFLLAIPVIAGAGLLTVLDTQPGIIMMPQLLLAFFSAFIVGTISLKWLLGLLERGKFHRFGYYCIMVGLITYSAI